MSVLNRITTLIRANINDALDRAENPEVMLDQILRDMYDGIREAREQVVEAVAQQKLVQRDLEQARELAEKWRRNAELAVAQGDDALARECLVRKRDYETNAQAQERMLAAQEPIINKLKSELALLESRYAELRSNRDSLLARYRAARAQEHIQRTTEQALGSVSVYDPSSQIERMERRIREKEAQVAARGEMLAASAESRLEALERGETDLEIEAELLSLKAAAGKAQLPSAEAPES
ncbi:MAG: PspA/IM30 family protein [Anaerolineae bacterium]|nr:PspA/IM30 family protein [Anaerolineae bacterium]